MFDGENNVTGGYSFYKYINTYDPIHIKEISACLDKINKMKNIRWLFMFVEAMNSIKRIDTSGVIPVINFQKTGSMNNTNNLRHAPGIDFELSSDEFKKSVYAKHINEPVFFVNDDYLNIINKKFPNTHCQFGVFREC
jgi:hypothetical protein